MRTVRGGGRADGIGRGDGDERVGRLVQSFALLLLLLLATAVVMIVAEAEAKGVVDVGVGGVRRGRCTHRQRQRACWAMSASGSVSVRQVSAAARGERPLGWRVRGRVSRWSNPARGVRRKDEVEREQQGVSKVVHGRCGVKKLTWSGRSRAAPPALDWAIVVVQLVIVAAGCEAGTGPCRCCWCRWCRTRAAGVCRR